MLQLTKSKRLTEQKLQKIQELHKICNDYEKINIAINYYMLKNRPDIEINDFLYYEDGKLIGYVGLFVYTGEEAEVSALVHPHYRRKSIFKDLLYHVKQELQRRKIERIIFIADARSTSAMQTLQRLGATYRHSTYRMQLDSTQILQSSHSTVISRAHPSDLDEWIHLESKCFNETEEESRYHMQMFWNRTDHFHFKYVQNGKMIGKMSVGTDEKSAHIYGLCVDPDHQGKGIAKALVLHILSQLKDQYEIFTLEVETNNAPAVGLYQKCGFQILAKDDYYEFHFSSRGCPKRSL
ncbi:GNAT family N-acetyltransferase [Thermoflavimicrobium dichotomicum]|uniref:Ribosomal protein S18 acetylase RimI n=1 Tax=Thermoflavimicrobium dichotomicum TaxID=46223 RepID=A0A1I3LWT1_9BACL|nr:GNAT family N-acetyltransferase [Thermoflavimicrobium dichotomicum]SFI89231.1 Ribosomal protein S18 acetylase RimI [Thermoflavimicrobium dichotomicum]